MSGGASSMDFLRINRSLNYGRKRIAGFLRESRPFATVLDVGAGDGSDLMSAREAEPQARLMALESHPPSVERLKGRGIDVRQVDIEKGPFPFEPESLDVVISNQTLEHTKEIFWIFHQMSRSLKVGGRLILGVPNLASLHNRLLLLFGRQPTCIQNNSAHLRGYTRGDVVQLMESCFPGGYSLEGFRGANFYPFPPFLAEPLSSMFPSMSWAIFMLFIKKKPYQAGFLEFPKAQRLETPFHLGDPR